MGELNHESVKCYDVIVIDTLGRLVELLVKKHSNASGIANQNTWGSVRRDLLNWWTSLLKLNKHIVLTAHGKQDGETYRPEVLGNSPALILRDLDYVGIVKEHMIMFNLPNSWCKNTHSKMDDEVIIDQKHGFMEMLLSGRETSVNESQSISYDKTIDNIANVTQLNTTYKFLIDNARDSSWKSV